MERAFISLCDATWPFSCYHVDGQLVLEVLYMRIYILKWKHSMSNSWFGGKLHIFNKGLTYNKAFQNIQVFVFIEMVGNTVIV